MTTDRDRRLLADADLLQSLQDSSSIFEFESQGEPPDRYTLTFHGAGVASDGGADISVYQLELHRCDVRLPYAYPKRPPDMRWLTPIFHPNVSFSGFISVADLGLDWSEQLSLDVVCERLWDTVRLAWLDLDRATNFTARNWFRQTSLALPVDRRPLRDRLRPQSANIVKYQRRDGTRPGFAESSGDVLYIGEDTPTPQLPEGKRPSSGDDDVLYIGDV